MTTTETTRCEGRREPRNSFDEAALCYLPSGHDGPHRQLSPWCETWHDPVPRPAAPAVETPTPTRWPIDDGPVSMGGSIPDEECPARPAVEERSEGVREDAAEYEHAIALIEEDMGLAIGRAERFRETGDEISERAAAGDVQIYEWILASLARLSSRPATASEPTDAERTYTAAEVREAVVRELVRGRGKLDGWSNAVATGVIRALRSASPAPAHAEEERDDG
jgi:hypothetical protein